MKIFLSQIIESIAFVFEIFGKGGIYLFGLHFLYDEFGVNFTAYAFIGSVLYILYHKVKNENT